MQSFIRIVSVFLTVLLLPLFALTEFVDSFSAGERTEPSKTNITGIGAYFRSQGVTTDGEYLYFSSKSTLYKTDMSGKNYVDYQSDRHLNTSQIQFIIT